MSIDVASIAVRENSMVEFPALTSLSNSAFTIVNAGFLSAGDLAVVILALSIATVFRRRRALPLYPTYPGRIPV